MGEAEPALPPFAQRVGCDHGEDFIVGGWREGLAGFQRRGVFHRRSVDGDGEGFFVRVWSLWAVGRDDFAGAEQVGEAAGWVGGEGEDGFDGEVVAERAGVGGVAVCHSDSDGGDEPVRGAG